MFMIETTKLVWSCSHLVAFPANILPDDEELRGRAHARFGNVP